ncbi:unnamed protein product [Rotaria magnacalcarata]|uniref:SAP domain-containing protein n=1 Tax=Rotaria magnacalcarata TaxID=392030 RepID=A0A8S3FWL9_9BILA|nr:unnamed protein product [Rotaria magnacalcarata]
MWMSKLRQRLTKLTIPMLKDYCREKKLKASGTKKQDFIDAIQSHLDIGKQQMFVAVKKTFVNYFKNNNVCYPVKSSVKTYA